jgi:hypothetical protein
MPHPDYPHGLWAFTMPVERLCAHVGASFRWRGYARETAMGRLSKRLGRYVSPSELDAGVWVMPEVQ